MDIGVVVGAAALSVSCFDNGEVGVLEVESQSSFDTSIVRHSFEEDAEKVGREGEALEELEFGLFSDKWNIFGWAESVALVDNDGGLLLSLEGRAHGKEDEVDADQFIQPLH